MRPFALLALAAFLFGAAPADAQPKRLLRDPPIDFLQHRYVPFPLPEDIAGEVHGHLDSAEALEPFKDLFEKIARDPKHFKLDAAAIKKLNLNDPRVQERLKGWIDRHPAGSRPSSGELKKLEEDVKELIRTQPQDGQGRPSEPPADAGGPAQVWAGAPEAGDEPVRDWVKNAMERMEGTNLGDWVKESPAWQKAFVDLQTVAPAADGIKGHWGLDRLNGGLFRPDKLPLPSAKILESLGSLRLAGLGRWNLALPSFPRAMLPAIGGAPVPPASTFGTFAIWLLGTALVAILGWQMLRWGKLFGRDTGPAMAGAGRWPVDPRQIATRSQLRQAFDYLARRALGPQSRSWNHRAVERGLANANAVAAEQLACLYELARYTEGAEALTEAERDRARAALAQLAGTTFA